MKIKALSGAQSSHNGNFLTSGSDIHFTSHNPHSNVKIMKRKEGDRQITLHDILIGYERITGCWKCTSDSETILAPFCVVEVLVEINIKAT